MLQHCPPRSDVLAVDNLGWICEPTSSMAHGDSPTPSTDERLAGVWAPVLTPFRADLSIDFDRFGAFCLQLLDEGCHGLALMGTTSETASLSTDERRRLLEAALAAGVSPSQIICGTGACALPDAVELTRHAVQSGCRATMILPPYYFKEIGDDGCYASIAEVIERVDDDRHRVVLYNIPRLSYVTFTPAVVARLVERFGERIAGIKDSSGQPMSTLRLVKAFRSLSVFAGTEGYLCASLKAGGVGCVTATANVRVGPIRALFDDWQGDDAREQQAEITAHRKELDAEGNIIITMKRMLADRTGHADWARVRPPLLS